MSTEIKSINDMVEQGGSIVDSAAAFKSKVEEIYNLYDNLKEKWTGEKSDEYKKKIDELRDPLMLITNSIATQGGAVEAAAEAIKKFERS